MTKSITKTQLRNLCKETSIKSTIINIHDEGFEIEDIFEHDGFKFSVEYSLHTGEYDDEGEYQSHSVEELAKMSFETGDWEHDIDDKTGVIAAFVKSREDQSKNYFNLCMAVDQNEWDAMGNPPFHDQSAIDRILANRTAVA